MPLVSVSHVLPGVEGRPQDGGVSACGLGCLVWVGFGAFVPFSTICLFFPSFNDDLGTMPTRRPYSWKKRNRMNGLTGLDTRDLDVFGAVTHWWRMNGLKGLDIRDLDVRAWSPLAANEWPQGALAQRSLTRRASSPLLYSTLACQDFVKTSYQDKKEQRG